MNTSNCVRLAVVSLLAFAGSALAQPAKSTSPADTKPAAAEQAPAGRKQLDQPALTREAGEGGPTGQLGMAGKPGDFGSNGPKGQPALPATQPAAPAPANPPAQPSPEPSTSPANKPSESPLTPSAQPSDKPNTVQPESVADAPGATDSPPRTGPTDPARTEAVATPADTAKPELPGDPDGIKPAAAETSKPVDATKPESATPVPPSQLPDGPVRPAVGEIEIGNQDGPAQTPQPAVRATAPSRNEPLPKKQPLAELPPDQRRIKAQTGAAPGLADAPGSISAPTAMPTVLTRELLKFTPSLTLGSPPLAAPQPQPQAVGTPSPSGQHGSAGGTSTGGGEFGQQSDKESDVFATRSGTFHNGRVEAGEGIEIKTVRPKFGLITRTMASPGSPKVEIAFDREGSVKRARILRSSGYGAEVDEPILDAVYQWRAVGASLSQLPNVPDAELRLVLTVYLR